MGSPFLFHPLGPHSHHASATPHHARVALAGGMMQCSHSVRSTSSGCRLYSFERVQSYARWRIGKVPATLVRHAPLTFSVQSPPLSLPPVPLLNNALGRPPQTPLHSSSSSPRAGVAGATLPIEGGVVSNIRLRRLRTPVGEIVLLGRHGKL